MDAKKKTLITWALIAVCALGIIAGTAAITYMIINSGNKNSAQEPAAKTDSTEVAATGYGADAVKADGPRVYSNAYDGFTYIRSSASSKAEPVGILKCGPEGARYLGTSGDWTEVECNGIVGYAYNKYVTYEPTKSVDINLPADWIPGIWQSRGDDIYYFIFDNGYYCMYNDSNDIRTEAVGKWKLEGKSIKLTEMGDYRPIDYDKYHHSSGTTVFEIKEQDKLMVNKGQKYDRKSVVKNYGLSGGEAYELWDSSFLRKLKKKTMKVISSL